MMKIYGAGMAGLLAANMLRRFEPVIYEAQPSLPNNHDALLRFRSSKVSDATGIPFRKVRVHKAIKYQGCLQPTADLHLSNLYSQKVTGKVLSRSIINLEAADRYIAPPDFISQMARSCRIKYDSPLTENSAVDFDSPTISTIPMPTLAALTKEAWVGDDSCAFSGIWSLVADLQPPGFVDVYQTIYYPEAGIPHYRASLTGSRIIIEFASSPGYALDEEGTAFYIQKVLLRDFGINTSGHLLSNINLSFQKYGKIVPLPEDTRKRRIMHFTSQYNIYSIGRFATWRQILMDDVVDDIKVVEQFIAKYGVYTRAMHYANKP